MAIVIGKIINIENRSNNNHKKSVLTVRTNSGGLAFIEFRGQLKVVCDKYGPGDITRIEYAHEGNISKKSGVAYNNLVAQNIELINHKKYEHESN